MRSRSTTSWGFLGIALVIPAVLSGTTPVAAGASPSGHIGLAIIREESNVCEEHQKVFSGENRVVRSTWKNGSDKKASEEISLQLFQATSSTVSPVGNLRWKTLELLPGQTVVEQTKISFPPVRGETSFLVQWLTSKNKALGSTSVLVYPSDILNELKALAGEGGPGVFDPRNALKPVLKNLSIDFVDLQEHGLDEFRGKLAIIGPFTSKSGITEHLLAQIHIALEQRMGIVWMQPPPEPHSPLSPSFYAVPGSKASLVIAQGRLGGNFAEDPGAQMRLLDLCRLALRPKPFSFPDFSR